MRVLASLGLLALSLPAFAGVESFVGSVDEVVITDVVEVPLAASADGGTLATVAVTAGDDTDTIYPFTVGGREGLIVVPADMVANLGLEAKTKKDKHGGEINYVDIDRLRIGAVELVGVRAVVAGSKLNGSMGASHATIGVGAVPELALAVLPSKGVVKFAPAAQGAELVASVGSPIPFTSTPWDVVKFGKHKVLQPERSNLIAAKIGGHDLLVALDLTRAIASISSSAALEDTTTVRQSDQYQHWLEASFGGQSATGWLLQHGEFERGQYQHDAVIGTDLLAGFDIAIDPLSSTLALAPAATETRVDLTDQLVAQAEKKLETTLAEQAEASDATEGDDDAAEAAKGAQAGAYAALAATYDQYQRSDEAMTTWAKVVELDAESCTNWQSYGSAQLAARDAKGAAESLSKASALFHAWWDNDLATRKDMATAAEKGEAAEDAPKEQPGACHTADGLLATANFVLGEHKAVEDAYKAHLDLDSGLALAYGNVVLARGDLAGAQAPLRQAMKLEVSQDPLSRLGLALTYAQQDDHETADKLFQKALSLDPEDAMAAALWLDNVRQHHDGAAALEAATAWAKGRPDSPTAHLVWVQAANAAGDADAQKAAVAAADALFEVKAKRMPNDAQLQATYARYLVTQGKLEAATKAADHALARDPSLGLAWLARADVAAASGDAASAGENLMKAGQLASSHPGYAMLLGQ